MTLRKTISDSRKYQKNQWKKPSEMLKANNKQLRNLAKAFKMRMTHPT